MILNRYIQRSIYLGTLGALLLLVSLSLFFIFVRELDDIGRGSYGLPQAIEFVIYRLPGNIVEFLPLAVLLGSILSLGSLASNSEIIAMQSSGMSIWRLISAVMQAAAVLAMIGFLLGDWVVPDTEARSRELRSLTESDNGVLHSEQGIWLKDDSRVVHIGALLPQGYARDIEIFELGQHGGLVATLHAARAIPLDGGWELQQVRKSSIGPGTAGIESLERIRYEGKLSLDLLQVLTVNPRMMSLRDLSAYLGFLDDNRLDSRAERLILWKKISSPMTIFVMCLLSIPFVLGSQRQTGSGQRLLIGILLGLGYVVGDRLVTQLGNHLEISPSAVALAPNLIFLLLGVYLLLHKLSHRSAVGAIPSLR